MPEPFQPKFVDLVRNFTTTQGTGNFVLGAAVAGHSSLAGAVATGEQFYYCAMGVDKPAEREVGRGTMLANGQIARDPISGSPTNFSNGTKTISLVVAADWFAAAQDVIQAGPGGGVPGGLSLTFATASGAALGATVKAVETAGFSTAGTGGARYVYDGAVDAAFVAAHPAWSFLAADGRGCRLNETVLQLEYFGAVPSDTAATPSADCYPAWLAMAEYQATYPRNATFVYRGTRDVLFPGSLYDFSDTLDAKHNFRLIGMSGGNPGGEATILRWPANKTGIRSNAANTTGLTTEGVPTWGGQITVENMSLVGGYAGVEGDYHGFHMRGMSTLRNVRIRGFGGDGIHIAASIGSGGATEGNANLFHLEHVEVITCRNGIYCDGADSNAGLGIAINASANRQWGIWDSSFLGNSWIACHADSNGLISGSPPTVVSHGGNRYGVKVGQEASASTNAPSGTATDNAYWYYMSAGGVNAPNNIPAWVSGTTYRAGGGYRSDGVNAETLFLGCYAEGGQGFNQGVTPTLSMGGLQGPWRGSAVHVSNYAGAFGSLKPIMSRNEDASFKTSLENGIGNEAHLSFTHSTKAPNVYTLAWLNNNLCFNYQGAGADSHIAYEITGPLSPRNIGTHKINFPILFGIADKKMLNGTAAPASGTYVQGDICWNTAPAAGGPPGWMCTAGGTPGTWNTMASLAA